MAEVLAKARTATFADTATSLEASFCTSSSLCARCCGWKPNPSWASVGGAFGDVNLLEGDARLIRMAVTAIDSVCYLFSSFLPPLREKTLLVLVRLTSKIQSDRAKWVEAWVNVPIRHEQLGWLMVVAWRVVLSGVELNCATVLMYQSNRLLLSQVERSCAVVLANCGVVVGCCGA
jgi:hypothetical protein